MTVKTPSTSRAPPAAPPPLGPQPACRAADIATLHSVLTVRQIMTARSEFLCGVCSDRVGGLLTRVGLEYDEVPIIEGDDPEDVGAAVVGVLRRSEVAAKPPPAPVGDYVDEEPVAHPLSPTTPILNFVRDVGRASSNRITLIGSRGCTDGLITISDLERLPVRIALFAHVIDLEERIGSFIEREAPVPEQWPSMVDDAKLSESISGSLRYAEREDHIGRPILAIGFKEKLAMLKIILQRHPLHRRFSFPSGISQFRNDLAHGKPFRRVGDVPVRVKAIDDLISLIGDAARPKAAAV